jgi:hypothetical protein
MNLDRIASREFLKKREREIFVTLFVPLGLTWRERMVIVECPEKHTPRLISISIN